MLRALKIIICYFVSSFLWGGMAYAGSCKFFHEFAFKDGSKACIEEYVIADLRTSDRSENLAELTNQPNPHRGAHNPATAVSMGGPSCPLVVGYSAGAFQSREVASENAIRTCNKTLADMNSLGLAGCECAVLSVDMSSPLTKAEIDNRLLPFANAKAANALVITRSGDRPVAYALKNSGAATASQPLAKEQAQAMPSAMALAPGDPSDSAGQVRLAWSYVNGDGKATDYAQAFRLFTLASAQGNWEGDRGLAWIYGGGLGVNRNESKALEILTTLHDRGHFEASSDLGVIYRDGKGVAKNEQRAFSYFEYAAQNGSAAGQLNMSRAYRLGQGIAKDDVRAAYW
ncbi:MAG: sel1 repeat family protein, partial [Rhodoferax sp.]|nr:sel1 repeat family protein [Rhodoferax sp.]